jgi:hypothetical protein
MRNESARGGERVEHKFVATVLVTADAETKMEAIDLAGSELLGDQYTLLDIRQATPEEIESN